VDGGAVDVGLV